MSQRHISPKEINSTFTFVEFKIIFPYPRTGCWGASNPRGVLKSISGDAG